MIKVQIRRKPNRKNLLLFYDDPVTGKEKSRSAGTSDHSDALKAAARWEDELLAFRGADDRGWQHFRLRFLTEHCVELSAVSTMGYTTALNHYEKMFSPKSVADVTADTLSTFKVNLLGKPFEQTMETALKQIRHIRSALSWAQSVGMIQTVPKLKRVRQHKRKWMRGRPITMAEKDVILQHCDAAAGERNAPGWQRLLELLWLSGLRIEEVIKLSWDSPPIFLQLEARPYPQFVFFVEGHKGRRDETVPIPPDLYDWLSATPKSERIGLVAPVYGEKGEPVYRADTASKSVARIGRASKVQIDGSRFAAAHDFRRAFGSRWALLVPPLVLQKMMRHQSIETTLKYYIGLDVSNVGASIWGARSPDCSPGKGQSGKSRRKKAAKTA